MTPKTERIELRLSAETLERIDNWRDQQEDQMGRSEAIRQLLEIGLEHDTKDGFRLNNRDKLLLWMMTKAVKLHVQGPEKAGEATEALRTAEFIQDAIFGGHFWALAWELPGVIHNYSDDPKQVRAVADILDVWSFIERAFAGFSDEEKQHVKAATGRDAPKFLGFDGNNESEYLGIARFFVEKMDRWQWFKGRDFNSHIPTVARYSAMARAFEPIRETLTGRELTAPEVVRLLKAV